MAAPTPSIAAPPYRNTSSALSTQPDTTAQAAPPTPSIAASPYRNNSSVVSTRPDTTAQTPPPSPSNTATPYRNTSPVLSAQPTTSPPPPPPPHVVVINLFYANGWPGPGIYTRPPHTAMPHPAESGPASLDAVAYLFLAMVLLFLLVPCLIYAPFRDSGPFEPVLRYTIVRHLPGRPDEREDIYPSAPAYPGASA